MLGILHSQSTCSFQNQQTIQTIIIYPAMFHALAMQLITLFNLHIASNSGPFAFNSGTVTTY